MRDAADDPCPMKQDFENHFPGASAGEQPPKTARPGNRKGNIFSVMKKIFSVAIVAIFFACLYLACNKAEQHDPLPQQPDTEIDDDATVTDYAPNGEVTERTHCGGLTECDVTVETDANVTLEVCGDLPAETDPCPYTSCSAGETSFTATWTANTPKVFCASYTNGGQVCLKNTGGSSVGVRIQFGTSTPISVTIGAVEVHCFHTNSSCDTFDDC